MPRCPHCAATRVVAGRCFVCGGMADAPVQAAKPLSDLEPTSYPPANVDAGRLPNLETTEEVLGDVRIPDEPEPASPPAAKREVHCPRCRVSVGGARLCPHCGYAVRPAAAKSDAKHAQGDSAEHASGATIRCLICGMQNSADSVVCIDCGYKL